jgi:hypothetical protein
MSTSASIVLGLHIVAGYVALFVAPGALLMQKGGWSTTSVSSRDQLI